MKNTQLNSIRWDLNWMTYQTFCSNAAVVFTWHKICINTAKKKYISYQFSWGKYFRDTIGLYCFFSVSKQVVDKNISSSRIRLKVFCTNGHKPCLHFADELQQTISAGIYLHLTDCDGRKLNVPTAAWLKIWKTIGGEKKKRKVLRRINSSQNGLYLRFK